MADDLPAPTLAARQLALRAIMDGRGVEAVILCSPQGLGHYGGVAGGLLVVTAREARHVQPDAPGGPWAHAAALLPPGCDLGFEEDAADHEALALVRRLARPRRMLPLSADLARQIAEQ